MIETTLIARILAVVRYDAHRRWTRTISDLDGCGNVAAEARGSRSPALATAIPLGRAPRRCCCTDCRAKRWSPRWRRQPPVPASTPNSGCVSWTNNDFVLAARHRLRTRLCGGRSASFRV